MVPKYFRFFSSFSPVPIFLSIKSLFNVHFLGEFVGATGRTNQLVSNWSHAPCCLICLISSTIHSRVHYYAAAAIAAALSVDSQPGKLVQKSCSYGRWTWDPLQGQQFKKQITIINRKPYISKSNLVTVKLHALVTNPTPNTSLSALRMWDTGNNASPKKQQEMRLTSQEVEQLESSG